MTTYITPVQATIPTWLPLLQKPYDNLLGSKPIWICGWRTVWPSASSAEIKA